MCNVIITWPELQEYKRTKSLRRQIILYFQLRLLAVISVIFSHAVFLSNRFHISLYLYVCVYVYPYIHIYIIFEVCLLFSFLWNIHSHIHTHTQTFHLEKWKNLTLSEHLLKGKDRLVLCILLDQILIVKCPVSIYLLCLQKSEYM